MAVTDSFTGQIFKDKLVSLYSSNPISTAATLTAASIYVAIQFTHHEYFHLLGWYSVIVAIYTGRYFLTKKFFLTNPPFEQLNSWLLRFRFAVILTGMTLSSTVIWFYPEDSVPLRMFTILYLAGMAAGGLTVLVADLFVFTGYVISLLLPVIVTTILAGDSLNLAIAAITGIFLLIILRASKRLNDIVTTSLQLRYENLALVEKLETEKNKLHYRLGRILNDSSNELFISDADTLRCLQVNKGALDNLGYTEDELQAIYLSDIIVDFDKSEFVKIIDMLRKGDKESDIYRMIQRRKDGSVYPVEIRFQLSLEEDPPVLVTTALDISERDAAERQLIHQANFDQLTNLPNRYFILSYIGSAFARAKRNKTKVALLFLDLNNFKDINDTMGHGVGDELLKQVATRIRSLLREADTAARLGGDEFLVLLEGLHQVDEAEIVVHKILESFNIPFFINAQELFTSASIGISTYPDDGSSGELLMQYADTAMYYAKQDTTCSYRFFSHELRSMIDEQLAIKNHLRHALRNKELSLYFQPKIHAQTGEIIGAEALLRWHNPELGQVPPGVFIPVAEKYGLVEELGAWVLNNACKEAVNWQKLLPGSVHVAVNISPKQFRSTSFLDTVDTVLETSGLPAHLLEVEITEGLLMQDTREPMEILNALRKRNITLSLDDFGTGYSSLSYLKKFPLQVLKVDRSFIGDMMENQYNMSLVDAIISMAQILGLRLVAEGVETREQFDYLKNSKVDVVQGYFFSPPVPAADFRAYILDFGGLPAEQGDTGAMAVH